MSSGTPTRVWSREWIAAITITAVLLVANLLSCSLYPTAWCDEVSFADPAINLATRGEFITYAWPAQRAGTFWTANTPLFPLLLGGWINLFGQSLLAIRSLNYLLVGFAGLALWRLARKYQPTAPAPARLLLIPLLHLGYGISFAYRSCRPDILGLLIVLAFAFSLGTANSRWRFASAALCGVAAVWTGLQIGLLLGVCAITAWGFKWVRAAEVIATALGGTLGVAAFLVLLHTYHAIPDFIASMALGRTGGLGMPLPFVNKLRGLPISYFADYSLLPLLAAATYFTARSWRSFDSTTRTQILFLGAWIVTIPLLLTIASKYMYYYSYMIYVPTCWLLVLTAWGERHSNALKARWRMLALTATATTAMLIGLPLRLWISYTQIQFATGSTITEALRAEITPNDVIVAENSVYFDARKISAHVFGELYYRFRSFTESEKNEVNTLIIHPADFDTYALYFGGSWRAASAPFGDHRVKTRDFSNPFFTRLLDRYFSTPQMTRVPLQIFKR